MQTQSAPVADLRHVSVVRENTVVLHDVSLRIEPGECLAILGPNGCGKSTLIKTLTCELYPLVRPETQVQLFGRARWDVTQLRRMFGVVTSEPPLRDALRTPGLEIVLSGFFSAARLWPNLQPTPAMVARAHQTMQELGVNHLAGRELQAMSAGQQKRIMIARALASSGNGGNLRVLLLDEPSNALDLAAQRDLRATMSRLARSGVGIILVTHHVEDIVPEVDRVIAMQDGRIVSDGPKRDALTTQSLSALFGTEVSVVERDGFYFAS